MSEVAITKSELPDSWELVQLQDVCSKVTDGTHKTPKYQDAGVRFISIKNIKPYKPVNWDSYVKFISREEHEALIQRCNPEFDDILFPRIGTLGYAKRVDFKEEVSLFVGLGLAKPIKDVIYPKYLEYWMNHPLIDKLSRERANGSGRLTLPLAESKKLPVPLAPLEQQKRIVAKIEELFSHIDAGIAALNKVKQLLKQYRQSVLKAAVTGELTKQWREDNKGKLEPASQLLERIDSHRSDWVEQQIEEGSSEAKRLRNKLNKHEFDDIESGHVPDGWISVSLLKLCQAVVDCHNKTAPYVDKGIPLIRTTNIRHGVINFEHKMKYITEETYDYWSRRCPPEAGDILFTREAPMGESAIVPEEVKLCMGQRMMLLRPIHQFTDVQYLHLSLMEPLFQSRFQNFKVGVGVQHLRVGDVEKSVIAMPSLEEQKEIVRLASNRLDAIERLESDLDVQQLEAEKNKQSILASAFSGGLISG